LTRDLGDFQTPPALVEAVLKSLAFTDRSWERVLEPTCGQGNFIAGILELAPPPREIQGIELQDIHVQQARKIAEKSSSTHVSIIKANLFDLDLRRDLRWRSNGPLLVVGNPPWVTNSELGALGSDNVPEKTNLKGLRGIDAITGGANFDIAEYIWLKLIDELSFERPTIALLCKTSVARNVLQFASQNSLPISSAWMHRIDAKKWFGAAVDACLFCVKVGQGENSYVARVYRSLESTEPESIIGIANGKLVADIAAYKRSAFADGVSPITWRQGLKHDAASVMELRLNASGELKNKLGETVAVEPDYIYPLLKSSDLFRLDKVTPHRYVIVTQRRLGEDTYRLKREAPRLWAYLTSHSDAFERRRSSIYRNKPPFSLFGIGDYSFSLYKVAISGMYKEPRFRLIPPIEGRPVMLDDTCYFSACDSPEQAALIAALLNDPICLDLVRSMVFWDSKRPITKRLLQRLDLTALLGQVDHQSIVSRAETILDRIGKPKSEQEAGWPPLEDLLVGASER